jgi:hypothetical protein
MHIGRCQLWTDAHVALDHCALVGSGLGCQYRSDGSYFYGTFLKHDRHGPGVVIIPSEEDSTASETPQPHQLSRSSRFRLHAAIFKNDQVHARWMRRLSDAAASDQEHKSDSSSETPDALSISADEQLVWNYLRRLIEDGLRAVIRLHHTPTTHLSTADIASLIESHLIDFSSPHLYHLISIPMSVYYGLKRGVCAYRISDEIGCPNQPYLCHTCSQEDARWEVCQVRKDISPVDEPVARHCHRALSVSGSFIYLSLSFCHCFCRRVLRSVPVTPVIP